jgi:hypothetical protein
MTLRPITLKEAAAFITREHRHHPAPKGWKFGIGLEHEGSLVGVAVVARPIARLLDTGYTAEVTRLATDGTSNACSMLYGAARRAAFAMGYTRIITYILADESGSSLKASGFRFVYRTRDQVWNRPGRPRIESAPTGPKQLWESLAGGNHNAPNVLNATR